jgi:hypothetical protein
MKSRAGWVLLAVVLLTAAGGAARAPDGLRLGMPGAIATAAVLLAAGLLWRVRPRAGDLWLGLAVVPALWLVVPRSAAAGALSGPPLFAAALAGLFAAGLDPERVRRFFVPVILVVYLVVAVRVQKQVGPQGDEPHYLMVADSLLRDGDLSLESDYRAGRYRAFFAGPLEPHFRVRGRHGEVYSLHALGLSLLVLPAYAAFGYRGVSCFMALLAVLTAVAVRRLLRRVLGDEPGVERAAWIVALSPPLIHYSGLVFTEVPAALIAAWVLAEGLEAGETSGPRAALRGAALAFLPWLNVRYAILAAVLGIYWLCARPRARAAAAFAAPAVASLAALGLYHYVLYGFFDPRRVYGREPELALATLGDGLPGLLLDQEFGLFVYAPVLVLAVPGLITLVRRRRGVGLAAAALVIAAAAVAGSWPMWRGGFNPPARFLVPVLPALALGAAAWLGDRRWAGAAMLAGWSVFAGLAGGWDPRLVHRDRDGTAPLFRERSGATEWTRLLPGYVLGEPDRQRLAILWAVVLAAAAIRGRRAIDARSLAVALSVLAAAAEVASRISDGRSGGREAARVIGRPSIDWPGGRRGRLPARWTTDDLQWGPVYEPRRHSGTALLAERLPLGPGAYTLAVEGEALGGGHAEPPSLRVTGPTGTLIQRNICAESAGRVTCGLTTGDGVPDVSLGFECGSTLRISHIELAEVPSTFPGSVGLILSEGR